MRMCRVTAVMLGAVGAAAAALCVTGFVAVGSATASPVRVIVLGEKDPNFPFSEGWGTVRPSRIFNGGDPSGLVTQIHWTSWGGSVAVGHGLNSIFAPQGGYYPGR